jgi:hypothetical protein
MPDKIITDFVFPPIPYRGNDWSAKRDGYEPHDPIGRGATEAEAIADLIAQEIPCPDCEAPNCQVNH